MAECFLPERNGVTNSVVRVSEGLTELGHQVLILAPGIGPSEHNGVPVARVPAIPLPMYRNLAVGLPTRRVGAILRDFRPDVVHLAAPAILGGQAARVCRTTGVPAVAVYQTDFAGFAERYGMAAASPLVWAWLRRVHGLADLTLVPSTSAAWEMERRGIGPVALWARGVDTALFDPRRRSELVRRQLGGGARQALVGYVGRLAAEKQVHLLAHASGLPEARTIVVGDGPERARLEQRLPDATFLGFRTGVELATLLASLDVFVHTGSNETFCQAIQEALASGVPVVAPAAGGPLDLVRHGHNGFLYPPDQPALIRGAVRSLLADLELRRAMAARARADVADRTWPRMVDELVGHYRTVTGTIEPARRRAA